MSIFFSLSFDAFNIKWSIFAGKCKFYEKKVCSNRQLTCTERLGFFACIWLLLTRIWLWLTMKINLFDESAKNLYDIIASHSNTFEVLFASFFLISMTHTLLHVMIWNNFPIAINIIHKLYELYLIEFISKLHLFNLSPIFTRRNTQIQNDQICTHFNMRHRFSE